MFERLKNFGICAHPRCATTGPRCVSNYCTATCEREHEYWVGHLMPNGKPTPITERNRQHVGFHAPVPAEVTAVTEKRKPEPGDIIELQDDATTFVPLDDTSRTRNAKTYPITYVK